MTIQEQVEKMIPQVKARAESMCVAAIGEKFSIREDKRTVQHGTISGCEVAWVGQRGMNVVAIFNVTLETPNGLHFGPYKVQRVPGRR
jgi:hypothetical protein